MNHISDIKTSNSVLRYTWS